jgi:cytochrome c-type biogenesis protein CcmE
MYGRKVKLRFFFIIIVLFSLILSVFLVIKMLEENVVYFKSPSDIQLLSEVKNKKIRVGGMVKTNSIEISSNKINFIITDFKNEINVSYSGLIPNLFSEGKGVVAEGYLKDKSFFEASKILAKHDETYMPPEVKAALEEK